MLCGRNNNSCYLKLNIGMTGTENMVDVREVSIRNFKDQLYLPPENYYACEVLPEDWIDIIPSQSKSKPGSIASPLKQSIVDTKNRQGSPIKSQQTLFSKFSKQQSTKESN